MLIEFLRTDKEYTWSGKKLRFHLEQMSFAMAVKCSNGDMCQVNRYMRVELREIKGVPAGGELNINCDESYRNEWEHLRRENKMGSKNLQLRAYWMTTIERSEGGGWLHGDGGIKKQEDYPASVVSQKPHEDNISDNKEVANGIKHCGKIKQIKSVFFLNVFGFNMRGNWWSLWECFWTESHTGVSWGRREKWRDRSRR